MDLFRLALAVLFFSLSYVILELTSFVRSAEYGIDNSRDTIAKGDPPPSASIFLIPPPTEIPIHNASSYVASDISKIVHVPTESRIEVHLKAESIRRCQRPLFKGRISGLSLSIIDFGFENATDVVVGTYDLSMIPVSGTYYLEIIVLLCERYSSEGFLGVDLRSKCIMETNEDSTHQITQNKASIDIDIVVEGAFSTTSQKKNSVSSRGRWLHKNFLAREAQTNHPYNNITQPDTTEAIPPPQPLYTKNQPKECIFANRNERISCETSESDFCLRRKSDFCQRHTSNERFYTYNFRWNQGPDAVLNEPSLGLLSARDGEDNKLRKIKPTTAHINVCFVGASHSGVLYEMCQALLRKNKQQEPSLGIYDLKCSNLYRQFPKDVSEGWVSNFGKYGCTHAVVGLFQWYFSYKNKDNVTFFDWKDQMTNVANILEKAARGDQIPLRRVLLRSAHPNALGNEHSQCPPKDFRSLPNADVATSILKEIAEGFSSEANNNNETPIVSFVDTGFLIDPVWDSSVDWSHYRWEAGEMETKFILSEILNEDRL